MPPKLYAVYLLRCRDSSLYCGITTNVARRLTAHKEGRGAKYVKSRLPAKLACATDYRFTRSEASREEFVVKALPKKRKIPYLKML